MGTAGFPFVASPRGFFLIFLWGGGCMCIHGTGERCAQV